MAFIMNKIPILCQATFRKNIIFGSGTKITRNMHEHRTNLTNIYAEKNFKFKDNISNDYKLIYREQNIINTVITIAYHAGWIGVGFSGFLVGYIIYKNPPVEEGIRTQFEEGGYVKPLSKPVRAAVVLFSLATSVALIVLSKTIPFRIYYNSVEKLYKAVFVRPILGNKQILTFSEGTAVPKFKGKRFGDVLFNINGRTVLLDKECFPVPYVREQMIRNTKIDN